MLWHELKSLSKEAIKEIEEMNKRRKDLNVDSQIEEADKKMRRGKEDRDAAEVLKKKAKKETDKNKKIELFEQYHKAKAAARATLAEAVKVEKNALEDEREAKKHEKRAMKLHSKIEGILAEMTKKELTELLPEGSELRKLTERVNKDVVAVISHNSKRVR